MKAKELNDLVISAFLLAVAFGIAFSGGIRAISEPRELSVSISLALVGVSSGFILHELGHRFAARKFGYSAEYTMWSAGLLFALACSMFGFIFAAPGAVVIHPRAGLLVGPDVARRRLGVISLTGPVMNLCLAALFIVLHTLYPATVFSLGARINTWLALFNLIPVGPLDGGKILGWDKGIWVAAVAVAAGLFVVEFFIF